MDIHNTANKRALILSGGGARAAYQVGVLSAIGKMLPRGSRLPFPILCGTSAGALNATMLATNAHNFTHAVSRLNYVWRHLTPEQVYEVNSRAIFSSLSKILSSLVRSKTDPDQILSLLDNTPLDRLLKRFIDLSQIQTSINENELIALAITCMSYSTGKTMTFFQGQSSLSEWTGFRRKGQAGPISFKHLMASSAIPTIFPATKIDNDFYGDGAMRQRSPISPAIQLGADKVMIIGVSGNRNPKSWADRPHVAKSPSIGQITGQLLNSAFIDNLEEDIQQLEYINNIIAHLPKNTSIPNVRPIESLVISPSKGLDEMASLHLGSLPKSIRLLLSITGNTSADDSSSSASYLLFTPEYCQALIDLGKKDAMWEKDKILAFLEE